MGQGKHVLIVDDESDVAAYMAAALEDEGYVASVAADAAGGLARIRSQRPDLVCLDVIMPGRCGLALYREMRETPGLVDIPVLVVSGLSEADATSRLGLGASVSPPDAFVEKPLDIDDFLSAVGRVLARRGGCDE